MQSVLFERRGDKIVNFREWWGNVPSVKDKQVVNIWYSHHFVQFDFQFTDLIQN